MKNQFNIIGEAVGVPKGIYETAVNVYERLVHKLSGIDGQSLKNQEAEFDLTIRGNFDISDMDLKTIKFRVRLFAKKTYKNIELVALRLDTVSKLNKDFKLEILKQKTVKIDLIIQVPNDEDLGDIRDYFINNKSEVIGGLVHELKHSYDFYKDNIKSPQEVATYQTFLELHTGIKPIDDFLHYCYYISLAENLVRPTELVSAIKNNQISQKDFIDFLTNNQTYKELKEIGKFSIENMIKELSNYTKEIDKFLKKRNVPNIPKLSQKKKIQKLLEIVYDLVSWTSIEKLQQYLSTEPIEMLLGFQGDKEKLFQDFVKRNQRFKTPIEFFKFYQNHFGQVSNQMLKKISKVYSLVPQEKKDENLNEDSTESEMPPSIFKTGNINWYGVNHKARNNVRFDAKEEFKNNLPKEFYVHFFRMLPDSSSPFLKSLITDIKNNSLTPQTITDFKNHFTSYLKKASSDKDILDSVRNEIPTNILPKLKSPLIKPIIKHYVGKVIERIGSSYFIGGMIEEINRLKDITLADKKIVLNSNNVIQKISSSIKNDSQFKDTLTSLVGTFISKL